MNIEKLKQEWQQPIANYKSQQDIEQMMALNQHAVIKRTKLRFVIENTWLIIFLLVFYDAFDGATKPVWASILLVSTTMAYIINRIIAWFTLQNPVKASDIQNSLLKFQKQLKLIAKTTIFTALFFGVAVMVFFSTGIEFNHSKYMLLFGMVITLVVLVYLSHRIWVKRIQDFESVTKEFEMN